MLVVLINYDLDSCYWRLSLTPTNARSSFCAKREKGVGGCVSPLEAHTQQSEADLAALCRGGGLKVQSITSRDVLKHQIIKGI